MDCCSSTGAAQIAPEFSPQIDQSADRLAALLAQTPEYQEFIRLARLIHLDPDVKRLSIEIRNRQMLYANPDSAPVEALQTELETLPAVLSYRKAEAAVKDLFRSVDQLISAATGVAFAPNAVKSGCG
jgi:cell fate (sporulation/competence/biofilm development) regulator YlbF (YheA/YmcA/DUF963 family)